MPTWETIFGAAKTRLLTERFPVRKRVVYVGPNNNFGRECVVVGHPGADSLKISFLYQFIPEPTFAAAVLDALQDRSSQWMEVHEALGVLRMSYGTLSRVVASIPVMGRDLGLNLRYGKREVDSIGYTRRNGKTWDVSVKMMEVIEEYRAHFPPLFEILETGTGTVDPNLLFPNYGSVDIEMFLDKICAWISEHPSAKASRVSGSTQIATPEAVAKLQKVLFFFSFISFLFLKKSNLCFRISEDISELKAKN